MKTRALQLLKPCIMGSSFQHGFCSFLYYLFYLFGALSVEFMFDLMVQA